MPLAKTVWRPTDGNGEMSTTTQHNITTLSLSNLITLSDEYIVTLGGVYTRLPSTVWDDTTIAPVSRWTPTDGNGEMVGGMALNIADPQGDLLIDTVGDFVVDTGLRLDRLPTTIWIED